ncbi:MAG: cobalamin B12-binding domain-containing protein [Deltaproteobacteria bacterium]|nr:cobalamin B12-binding domain-containing protein [Deltaproteobacteria bacterium]
MAKRRLRIMVAKPGLDGHDRGARVLARCFRDAGYETIYTGCHQTPEEIAAAAIQEDIDCLGLSCMSGAHRYLFPETVKILREMGGDDIQVIGGGIIPKADYQILYDAGLKGVFVPGITLDDIIKWIDENIVPNVSE